MSINRFSFEELFIQLFLMYMNFLSPVVIQGFERNLRSFLERCLTGICLSILVEILLQKVLNISEDLDPEYTIPISHRNSLNKF